MDNNWWQNNKLWQNNLIPSNTSSRSRKSGWVFFLVLLAFTGFILYEERFNLIEAFNEKNYSDLMPLVVIFFPVMFFIQQVKNGLGNSRFGETPFFMNPFPAKLGEKFSGTIEIKDKLGELDLIGELLLKQNVEAEQGDNRNLQEYVTWKMPVEIIKERSAFGIRLLVNGSLPLDQPPSEPLGAGSYFWRLHLYTNDRKFKRTWDVPILKST